MGAAPIALTILRDANTGAGQDPHRPDCGGSTPPSCRDWVASIAAMQRSLKPQSTGQHRGDPPVYAGVAQQRQQQFRKLPGSPPHGSASLPVGPISCSRSSNYQSGRLRTARLQARILPGVPFWACGLTRIAEGPDSESGSLGGASPFMPTNFTAPGLRGNSRPQRLKIAEPSGCKSRGADRRVVNREQQTGSAQTRTALGVQVSPRRLILEWPPVKRAGPRC